MNDHVTEALDWIDDFIARCNGDDRGACSAVNTLREAITKKAAPVAVPDGWKLVPVEPTEHMMRVANGLTRSEADRPSGEYRAMVRAAPNPPAQPLDLKRLCTHFYYWWHNQPGTNTEQGFDAWFEAHGRALLSIHSDAATPAQPVRYSASAGSTAVNPGALLPGTHVPTPPAHGAAPVAVPGWTEAQVHDFLSVAMRHAEFYGKFLLYSDINDGLRYMAEKGQPAFVQPAPTPPAQQPVGHFVRRSGFGPHVEVEQTEAGAFPLYAAPPAQPGRWKLVIEGMPAETDDDGSVVIEAMRMTYAKVVTSARYLRENQDQFMAWRLVPDALEGTAPPAQQSQWVSVDEQLPDLNTPALLYDPEFGTFFGMRCSSTGGWTWVEGAGLDLCCGGVPAFRGLEFTDCDPILWLPLPSAPGDTAVPEQAEQDELLTPCTVCGSYQDSCDACRGLPDEAEQDTVKAPRELIGRALEVLEPDGRQYSTAFAWGYVAGKVADELRALLEARHD